MRPTPEAHPQVRDSGPKRLVSSWRAMTIRLIWLAPS